MKHHRYPKGLSKEDKETLANGLASGVKIEIKPRFFVDLRSGCGAVRDRLHPNFEPDYQGLHNDTCDVVKYRHGYQNSKTKSWDMRQEDIDFLNDCCASLNGYNGKV